MNKKVLITGAFGFIGRYTAKCFAKNGWKVIGLGHGEWSRQEWQTWGIKEWHTTDITIDSLLNYAGEPDVIVHCAGSGSVGFSIDHPLQDFERTAQTTQYILEFVRVYSPKTKIVYPSSAAVYGAVNQIPTPEDSLLNPISPYGVHKKITEELCRLYAKQYNLSVAIIRLFSIYGAGLRKQLLWDACNKLEINDTFFFGTGLETRDWVHVDDVASLLYLAHEKANSTCPIVNGGSGAGILIKDVLSTVFSLFNRKDKPRFIGTKDIGNPMHYQADIQRIGAWGWKPKVNFHQGIEEYVRWYQEGVI